MYRESAECFYHFFTAKDKDIEPAKPPKTRFVPDRAILRVMIEANLKYSKKDNEQKFLLRFGLLDDPNWYLHNCK